MILSDRTIREQLAAGRIVIDPLDETCIQPSSVDLRLDRLFRVFLNHTMPVIDVKQDLEDLTRLVEIEQGEAFILHPGEFVLGSTYERVALPDDLVARIEGKALAIDTEIPTSRGWRLMRDLRVGDEVFGLDGAPVPVVAVTPPMAGRPCREVAFSDGTTIVADVAHEWLTRTGCEARRGRWGGIRTTEQIEAALRCGRLDDAHRVPRCRPAQYRSARLPVDPHLLGVWIGTGASARADTTCTDPSILRRLELAGAAVQPAAGRVAHPVDGEGHGRDPASGRHGGNGSLGSVPTTSGPAGDMPVPREYLRADVGQRQALLDGLMDAGGDRDEWGRREFTTVRAPLATQVRELVASLGLRPVLTVRPARPTGLDHGTTYAITFTPDRPAMRLPHKLARQKRSPSLRESEGGNGWAEWGSTITSVREVGSVPVRCIQVGSADGMFLVTRSYIPTHNSSLGRLGLLIHSTAGFVDAGFSGHITLELSNVANLPITLYPGMKIGQVSFLRMTTPADLPYGSSRVGSKYQGQRGPTPSRYWENFRDQGG
jgi:deoxycytidine triphosphate deaminase